MRCNQREDPFSPKEQIIQRRVIWRGYQTEKVVCKVLRKVNVALYFLIKSETSKKKKKLSAITVTLVRFTYALSHNMLC